MLKYSCKINKKYESEYKKINTQEAKNRLLELENDFENVRAKKFKKKLKKIIYENQENGN